MQHSGGSTNVDLESVDLCVFIKFVVGKVEQQCRSICCCCAYSAPALACVDALSHLIFYTLFPPYYPNVCFRIRVGPRKVPKEALPIVREKSGVCWGDRSTKCTGQLKCPDQI